MEERHTQVLMQFLKAAAQVDRLRILGFLANRPYRVSELAQALDANEPAILRHLRVLQSAGLLYVEAQNTVPAYRLDVKALEALSRSVLAAEPRPGASNPETEAQKVLRHFLDGERLKAIPENHGQRLVVLRWLAGHFEMGRRYPESEVNEMLQRHHPDYASLRRYLVDNQIMQRAHGFYWRLEA